MNAIRKNFRLNRRDAKVCGVCSGLSDYTGWDATWIRVGLVIGTLLGAAPWTLIGYGLTAWIAKPAERDVIIGQSN